MKPSDDMFQLIRRMSPSEKRSFSLFTQRYRDGEKKYLLLFEALRKQNVYSEKEVKEAVMGEIKPENFASAKNYLWNLLNDFLIIHAQEQYQFDKCRRVLDRAHLQHKRGIVQAAQKELRNAKKIAEKYEFTGLRLQINRLERNMLKRYQRKRIQKEMEECLGQYEVLKAIRREQEVQAELYDRLAGYMRSNLSQMSPEDVEAVRQIGLDAALSDTSIPKDFGARRLYFQSRCFVFHVLRKLRLEFEGYQRLLELWDKNPHQKKELYVEYRLFLCNYLHSAAHNLRYDLFPDILNQLDALPIDNEEDEIEAFSVGLFYRHLLALNEGKLAKARELLAGVPERMELYGEKMADSTRLGFQANLLFTYFLSGDYQKAGKWAEKLRNHPLTQHRVDLQGLSKVFEVIASYEMVEDGQYEHVVSRIRADAEWFRKRDMGQPFERTILNHLSRLIQKGSEREKSAVLKSLLTTLNEIGPTKAQLGLEEVLCWTQSKLQGRSIADLFSERKKG